MYYQTPKISPCVKGLIIANAVVFVLQLLPFIGDTVTRYGAMMPWATFTQFQFWRLATYMFLHSPDMLFHILFNMLALWWFGMELEDIWGGRKFLTFYFICGIGAGLFSLFYLFIAPFVWVIGASGAVLGILTAYAHYYPTRQVLLFFVFPVKVRTLVIGYAIISVLLSLQSGPGGTAHLTHLGGILIAWLYLKFFPLVQFNVGRWLYNMKKKQGRRK
ncbi:MAG: rhomboid family intramembrane serine protease [Chitinispirillales bacterium]|jgi:membrane associated rhomboid family serine protease|nr:rhomboid family intramembrane serine protease [Chitinispirillales bacterium]